MSMSGTGWALEVMSVRATTVLDSLLLDSPLTRAQYLSVLGKTQAGADIEFKQRHLLRDLLSSIEINALSNLLGKRVGDTFWTTLITRLIEDGRCDLINFGKFEVFDEHGVPKVRFAAAAPVRTLSADSIELPHHRNKVQQLAISLCHEAFVRHFETFAPLSDETLEVWHSRFLTMGLPSLLTLLQRYLPGQTGRAEIDYEPSFIYARSLGYATYLSMVAAFAQCINATPVSVDFVGTFQQHGAAVSFDASIDLLGLLSAMTPA